MTEPSPSKKLRLDSPHAAEAIMTEAQDAFSATESTAALSSVAVTDVAHCAATSDVRKRRLFPVPLVNECEGGAFYYERECYEEYYETIEGLLAARDDGGCVTVTGTPGIGKSVFYAYFAEKYLKSHPGVWIIAVANAPDNATRVALLCEQADPVFPDDEENLELFVSGAYRRAEAAGKSLLWLHSGPPEHVRGGGPCVVFTNPNKNWYRITRKLHRTYYMPLWTREELHTAARVLGLPLDDKVIDERFDTFGGVAHYCLHPDPDVVKGKADELCDAITQISNVTQLRELMWGNETSPTSHRLLHYESFDDNKRRKSTQLASAFVEARLAAHLASLTMSERYEIRDWLKWVPHAGKLYRQLFETETHQALRQGCCLYPHPLASPATGVERMLLTSTGDVSTEFDGVTSAMAAGGPYHQPSTKCFESIDSFYLRTVVTTAPDETVTQNMIVEWTKRPENRLLLFQITVADARVVDAAELLHVLDRLGLLDSVAEDPQRAALVFVVPFDKVKWFRRQTISQVQLAESNGVETIGGIDEKTAAELEKEMQIRTIGELQAKMLLSVTQLGITSKAQKASWARVCELALKHGLKTTSKNYGDAVAQIPQYVCTWEEPPVEFLDLASEVRRLQEILAAQDKQIDQQAKQIDELKERLRSISATNT